MTFTDFLVRQRDHIVRDWFELIIRTYPAETVGMLRRTGEAFSNPAGSNISRGLRDVYDELLKKSDTEKLSEALDFVIRIRSIQDFAPSQAVAFVFQLKRVVRDQLAKEGEKAPEEDLRLFDSRVDRLSLLAFDVYTSCREQLYRIKLDEFKRRDKMMRARSGAQIEVPSTPDPDPGKDSGCTQCEEQNGSCGK